MTKKQEKELVKLLTKLYKKNWNFSWQGVDNGFQLILQVYKNDKPTRKLINKLVARNLIIKRKQILDNGYIFREMKKI